MRGLGFGVTLTKLKTQAQQQENSQRYEKKFEAMMRDQREQMLEAIRLEREQMREEMREEMREQMREEMRDQMREEMREQMQEFRSLLVSENKNALSSFLLKMLCHNYFSFFSCQTQNANNQSCPNASPRVPSTENVERKDCELFHYNGTGLLVATGEVVSSDPSTLIGDAPLGSDCWKVWVDFVFESEAPLYRADSSGRYLLGQAHGNSIAWPSKFIKISKYSKV